MNLKHSISLAIAASIARSATSFSSSIVDAVTANGGGTLRLRPTSHSARGSIITTTLHYRNYEHEAVEVDGVVHSSKEASLPSKNRSERPSPITQLHSIQDYHEHVLNEPNQMCIIRFSAPWCRMCRSTNVAWERMASKITNKMSNTSLNNNVKRIHFLAVSIDGKDEATTALKDMLQILQVPQGIIHHPTKGLLGQRVDLHRSNLSSLRKQLERCLEEEDLAGLENIGVVLPELKGEVELLL